MIYQDSRPREQKLTLRIQFLNEKCPYYHCHRYRILHTITIDCLPKLIYPSSHYHTSVIAITISGSIEVGISSLY